MFQFSSICRQGHALVPWAWQNKLFECRQVTDPCTWSLLAESGKLVYTELSGHILLGPSASYQTLIRVHLMENVSHLDLISIILELIYMQHHHYIPQKLSERTGWQSDLKTLIKFSTTSSCSSKYVYVIFDFRYQNGERDRMSTKMSEYHNSTTN